MPYLSGSWGEASTQSLTLFMASIGLNVPQFPTICTLNNPFPSPLSADLVILAIWWDDVWTEVRSKLLFFNFVESCSHADSRIFGTATSGINKTSFPLALKRFRPFNLNVGHIVPFILSGLHEFGFSGSTRQTYDALKSRRTGSSSPIRRDSGESDRTREETSSQEKLCGFWKRTLTLAVGSYSIERNACLASNSNQK